MTKRSNSLCAVLGATTLLVQLTACGDSPGPGPGGSGSKDGGADSGVGADTGGNNDSFNAATTASRLATAQCQFTTRCQPAIFAFLGQDEATCISETTTALTNDFTRITAAITANRVRYSSQAFDRCVGALASADCITQLSNECDGIFTGLQAMNQPCYLNFECGENLYCDIGALGLCGRCLQRVGLAADCSAIPCARGLDCVQVSMTDVACVPVTAEENATCGTIQTGLCRGNLQCIGDQNGATCRRPAGTGQTCDPMGATNADCNIYVSESCINGMCGAASFNGAGQTCNQGAGQFCNGDSSCNAQTMMCGALPTAGSACTPGGACGTDAYCDGQNCLPQKTSGSACDFSNECQSDTDFCIHTSSTTPGSCAALNWRACN